MQGFPLFSLSPRPELVSSHERYPVPPLPHWDLRCTVRRCSGVFARRFDLGDWEKTEIPVCRCTNSESIHPGEELLKRGEEGGDPSPSFAYEP